MRQSYDPGLGVSISSLAYEYKPGWQVPEHIHRSDQLIYATRGAMEVTADRKIWLIPPQFAVWLPAQMCHSIRMPGAVSMRTLYLRSGIARGPSCTVLHVTPLLRELIVEAVRLGDLKIRNPLHRALRELIAAQVNAASSIPTSLAMPHDTRALALAQDTIRVTRQTKPLHSQCRRLGLSVRTMQRIFRREVGIDFETWRRQARLMKAVELLAQGRSVKEVSFAVGYRQPGSFVTLFRETFGTTPKAWIAALNV